MRWVDRFGELSNRPTLNNKMIRLAMCEETRTLITTLKEIKAFGPDEITARPSKLTQIQLLRFCSTS